MANENNKKKNPISIYWIYGFLGLALISFATLNSPKKTFEINSKETFLSLAADGYVSKVEIIKADSKFRIDFVLNEKGKNFIKNSQKGEFKKMKKIFQGKSNAKVTEPVYELNIVVITPITEQISIINENLKKEHKEQIITSEKEEVDYFGGILGFLLPIIILVAIYLFVMRRMSGGGGAGGGSQIFNIGK